MLEVMHIILLKDIKYIMVSFGLSLFEQWQSDNVVIVKYQIVSLKDANIFLYNKKSS